MLTVASTWVRMMATVAIIAGAPLQAFAATKCGDLNDVFADFAMLEDIIPLAGQSDRLMRRLHEAFSRDPLEGKLFLCSAELLGARWSHLAGCQIPPYRCLVSEQDYFELVGEIVVISKEGEILQNYEEMTERGKFIVLKKPVWRWSEL